MKKIIYGSILLGLMVVTSLSSCKKDEPVTPISNETVESSMISHPPKKQGGRLFLWDAESNKYKFDSYFMRLFVNGPPYGIRCFNTPGTCLADAYVSLNNPTPTYPGGNLQYYEEEQIAEILNLYSIPFQNALGNTNAIKEFFNDVLLPSTEFPQEVINDMNNDVITIKEFAEKLFFVNMNATTPSDVPVYNW